MNLEVQGHESCSGKASGKGERKVRNKKIVENILEWRKKDRVVTKNKTKKNKKST